MCKKLEKIGTIIFVRPIKIEKVWISRGEVEVTLKNYIGYHPQIPIYVVLNNHCKQLIFVL